MIKVTYTLKDLVNIMNLSDSTLRKLIKDKKLRRVHGTGKILVSQKALDDYLNEPAEVK